MPAHDLSLHIDADGNLTPKEIVLGLHWDPPGGGNPGDGDDLDALCVLLDSERRVLDVVHPGHPRNADGSVIHTGDSRTGTSTWDDERIFVFLDALPAAVAQLSFVVASAQDRPFSNVPGAACHVSDRLTEHAWVRLDLTALDGSTAHCVATLQRGAGGWALSTDTHPVAGDQLSELRSIIGNTKTGTDRSQRSASG